MTCQRASAFTEAMIHQTIVNMEPTKEDSNQLKRVTEKTILRLAIFDGVGTLMTSKALITFVD